MTCSTMSVSTSATSGVPFHSIEKRERCLAFEFSIRTKAGGCSAVLTAACGSPGLRPVYIARAASREAVRGFRSAALGVGGEANGAPAIGEHYAPDHCATFALNPDDNNVEAVTIVGEA
jgi:hypothetical protein